MSVHLSDPLIADGLKWNILPTIQMPAQIQVVNMADDVQKGHAL